MLARPHHQGETSATPRCVGSRHASPSPPEHRVRGRIWPRPPPRAITRQKTRCQSYGKDEDVSPYACHTVSYEVNAFPLQYALNRLNILLILAGNTDIALDLTVTVLENFELKRDTIKTKNDVPTR